VSRSVLSIPQTLLVLGVVGWVYWPTFFELYDTWSTHPEYSHGMLVPFFVLYLAYRQWGLPRSASEVIRPWPIIGFGFLIASIGMRLFGAGTSFLPLEGLSFVLCLTALVMIAGGKVGLKRYWQPIVFCLFMIPLPYEISRAMGAELQTLATICSTFLLQSFGQPALAEGNRILINDITLNVVEACSGLRMLVTFIGFSVAAVFLMERHWVVKWIVLLSAVPIALVTNILRITGTGLAHIWLHDSPNRDKVMDFIHDFNGWMMMPVGLTFLMFELWLLKHLLIERATYRPRVAETQSVPMAMAVPMALPVPQAQSVPQAPQGKPKFVSVIRMPQQTS
jgi:exosortase